MIARQPRAAPASPQRKIFPPFYLLPPILAAPLLSPPFLSLSPSPHLELSGEERIDALVGVVVMVWGGGMFVYVLILSLSLPSIHTTP